MGIDIPIGSNSRNSKIEGKIPTYSNDRNKEKNSKLISTQMVNHYQGHPTKNS